MRTPGAVTWRRLSRGQQMVVMAVVIGLVLGLLVAPFAYEAAVQPAPDRIAIVPIAGVMDGANAADVTQRLIEVRNDRSVDAVVLVVNSPGGLATAGEEIYQQVKRTSDEKPMVAVVDSVAASAGYKAVLPADEIYAKPASTVGSVGVILQPPPPTGPIDGVITSGPDKIGGQDVRGYEHSTAVIAAAFSEVVMDHRGDSLELTREEVEHARIYSGLEGAQLGWIDGIADIQGAIQAAADLAELDSYVVTALPYRTEIAFLDRSTYAAADQPEQRLMTIDELVSPAEDRVLPEIYMLPATAFSSQSAATIAETNTSMVGSGGASDGE